MNIEFINVDKELESIILSKLFFLLKDTDSKMFVSVNNTDPQPLSKVINFESSTHSRLNYLESNVHDLATEVNKLKSIYKK